LENKKWNEFATRMKAVQVSILICGGNVTINEWGKWFGGTNFGKIFVQTFVGDKFRQKKIQIRMDKLLKGHQGQDRAQDRGNNRTGPSAPCCLIGSCRTKT
jgi:hypothetical protein